MVFSEIVENKVFEILKNYQDLFLIDLKVNLNNNIKLIIDGDNGCLLYTSPSPRDATLSRMPSSA